MFSAVFGFDFCIFIFFPKSHFSDIFWTFLGLNINPLCLRAGASQRLWLRISTAGRKSLRLPASLKQSRAAKRGGSKRGGFPIWTCPAFFALFGTFPVFPGLSRFVPGLFGDFPDLSFSSFSANLDLSQKNGKLPGLETPRFSFTQTKKRCYPKVRISIAIACDFILRIPSDNRALSAQLRSGIPKRGRSKRGRTQKPAKERK